MGYQIDAALSTSEFTKIDFNCYPMDLGILSEAEEWDSQQSKKSSPVCYSKWVSIPHYPVYLMITDLDYSEVAVASTPSHSHGLSEVHPRDEGSFMRAFSYANSRQRRRCRMVGKSLGLCCKAKSRFRRKFRIS